MTYLDEDTTDRSQAPDTHASARPSLSELVDTAVIQSFLDDFAMVSGLPVGLMDESGTILLHAGWQDVCTQFHLVDEKSRERCFETEMPRSVDMEPGTYVEFTCANGLRNIITPLFLDAHPIGAVFVGQFLYADEEPDLDFFRTQAEMFGFDGEAYVDAVARLPRSPHDAADRLMRIAGRVATHVALTQKSAQELESVESERAQAEHALRESEDKFRYVFDHAMVGMSVTGLDGQLQPNDALAAMLGYTPDELRDKRWHDVTYPDDVALNERALAAVFAGEAETARFQKRYLHRDGSVVWGDVSTTLRRDAKGEPLYFLTVVVDITDRRRAEAQLENSEHRFRSIMECSPIAMYLYRLEDDGRLVLEGANPAADQIIGIDHQDLVGLTIEQAFPHLAQTEVPEMYRAIARGDLESQSFEIPYQDERFSGFYSVTVFRSENDHVVVDFVDISDRKRFETELLESNERLSRIVADITRTIGKIIEKRDPYTQGHETGVASIAGDIARAMGLDETSIATIETASLLHDIGKVAIPAEILSKPGALNAIEINMVRTHPQVGHDILSEIDFGQPIAQIVLQHHERIDGSGYPRGLAGDDIMLEARIIAVADVVEAMSGHRPYRAALGIEAAIAEIESGSGTIYDREVCQAFLSVAR